MSVSALHIELLGDELKDQYFKNVAHAIYEYEGNLYRVAITLGLSVSSINWCIENDESGSCMAAYRACLDELLATALDRVIRRVKSGDSDMFMWFVDKYGGGGGMA